MNFGRLLSLASFAIAGALIVGCNGLEDRLDPQPKDARTAGQKITLSFDGDAPASKAISAAGVKTFVPGDKISVIYENTVGSLVRVVSDALAADDIREEGRKADFTVTLTDPQPNGVLFYVYPADMVDDELQMNYDALNTQDGTLATIGRDLDLSIFQGELTSEGKLPAAVTLQNYFALLEISILNADASYDITKYTKNLTVSDGVNTYIVTPPAPASTFGAGPVYVLINPCVSFETLSFTTDGGITKEVSGHDLKAGHMYPIGLRLGEVIDLRAQTESDADGFKHYTAHHGDVLCEEMYKGYVSIANGATVTLSGTTIDSGDNCSHPVLGCLGDGTILLAKDTDIALQVGDSSFASGIYVPKGKTVTLGGEGSLYIDALNSYGAAIGGAYDSNAGKGIDCGTIIIEGGIIDVDAGYEGAGIGSGSNATCDGIIIRGGFIKQSRGGDWAAGIGCGMNGICGDILISAGSIGGKFESWFYDGAVGGDYVAGIGCGEISTCGDITIGPDITYIAACCGRDARTAIGPSWFGECGTVTVAPELEDTGDHDRWRFITPATPEGDD